MSPGVAGTRVQPAERVLVGLCHDLNDRLAVLHGLLHLGARDGSIGADAVASLSTELERMELLVGRMRQLAREPEGYVEALIVPELLDEALALVRHHTDRSTEPITIDAPHYLPPVRGDRSALRAVLLAAASQLPDAPGVSVACEHVGDDVVVRFPLAAPSATVPRAVGRAAHAVAVRVAVVPPALLELRLRSLLAPE